MCSMSREVYIPWNGSSEGKVRTQEMQCSVSIISASEATRMSLIVRRQISCKKCITSPHNASRNNMRIVQEKWTNMYCFRPACVFVFFSRGNWKKQQATWTLSKRCEKKCVLLLTVLFRLATQVNIRNELIIRNKIVWFHLYHIMYSLDRPSKSI